MADACAHCAKTKSESDPGINLKYCAKCQTTQYCSRECQKADWKKHKKICASNAAAASANNNNNNTNTNNPPPRTSGSARSTQPPPKNLSFAVEKPFHRLDSKTWMHERPEQDVYKLLIDTYRLRMEDNYNLEGDADADGIYGGARDGRQGFRRFLRLAEGRRGLLPSWWSQEKAAECEAVGMRDGWSSLATALEKRNVIDHYGNPNMPMQLRMFGEQVYGRGPGGQSGAMIRTFQMQAERGEMVSSTFDISSLR